MISSTVLGECRKLYATSKDIEVVLSYLRNKGFFKIDAIKAIIDLLQVPLTEAKRTVHFSKTWADTKEPDEQFHEALVEGLQLQESLKPIEHADYWEIPVQGQGVTRCCIDYAFRFDSIGQHTIGVRIEAPFSLKIAGEEHLFHTEKQVTDLGLALSILHQTVISFSIFNNGRLEVCFGNDISLTVLPDSNYEAWEFWAEQGVQFVCLPGGGLSIWGDW